jgi:WD40 repeat protein/Tfp pilus assembly protein PilF
MAEMRDDLPDPLDAVVEEFLDRRRSGESPSAEEYALRHPELADRIRALFPTLLLLEGRPGPPEAALPGPSTPPLGEREGPPEALGSFRIVRVVGRGGMGVVYEAVQEPLGRRVALKVLPAECAHRPSYRERFEREAAAAAKLQHTNIVPVFASGEHDGTLWFAMQYIDGRTVAGLVADLPAQGSCPADRCRQAARLAVQAAEALACAHSHGILHRDVKPANLLVDASGTLWVADFGLAKASDADDLTGTGELVGTLRYLAPERFAGACDARSDVYGLGATLYEMLALRPAFDETDRLRLMRQVAGGAPPLRRVAPGVPPDLETVVRKAMAADPADRYPTAQELADDLRLFLADRPVKARRASSWERLRRWWRHNPGLAWMAAAVAGLLLAVAVGASLLSLRLSGALGRARQAEQETQRKLFDSLVAQARAVHRGGRSGQRFESLNLLDQAAELARGLDHFPQKRAELRNVAIAALAVPDLCPVQTWDGFPPGSVDVDFDERLEVYARTDDRGNCSVRRVAGDVQVAFLPGPDPEDRKARPVFSRDARFVAVRQAGGKTRVWQLDGAGARALLDEADVLCVDFHPTRPLVAFALGDGSITLRELPAGRSVSRLPPDGAMTRDVFFALHPTEPLVAVTSYFSRAVHIRDLRTGELVKSLDLPHNGYHVAWHPAGHTLAASDGDGSAIHLFDRATFRRVRTISVHGFGSRMFYNRAGDRLAVSDWSGGVGLYEADTGRPLFQLSPQGIIPLLRFDTDGRRLAGFMQDDRLGIWQVGEGREYRTLRHSPTEGSDLGVGRLGTDGRLAVAAVGQGVAFWDLDTGTEIRVLPLEKVLLVDVEPAEGGALLLGDDSGVYRWPVRADPGVPGRRRIGPPQALGLPAGIWFGQSRDGRVVATAVRPVDWYQPWAGGWVRHADHPDRLLHREAGADLQGITVSPDGRWVVTVQGAPGPVKLWDAHTGRLERVLEKQGRAARFSPDGRWLAVCGPGGELFAVGSWEAVRKLGDWGSFTWVQFAPDSRTLVVPADSRSGLRLIETDTGRELARLEAPHLNQWSPVFTPDGSRLLMSGEAGEIHVWDLRRIRVELARRDLDWDAPAYPAPPAPAEPLTVELDEGDFRRLHSQRVVENFDRAVGAAEHLAVRWFLRGKFHQRSGRYAEALRDLREAVRGEPDRALFCNALARFCVVAPEPFRDARAAVPLAEKAVKLQPGAWAYVNTLGIAYYRAGRYADAVAALQKSLAGGAGESDAANLYFLALCQHRLGDATGAEDCLQRARAWHERHADRLTQEEADELREFRAEAEAVVARPPQR